MDPYNSADVLGVPGAAAPARPAAVQPGNPYAAPRAAVRDVRVDGAVVLASRLARLGAYLLDSLAVLLPLLVIAVPAYQDYAARARGLAPGGGGLGDAAVGVVVLAFLALAVVQLVLLHRSGQTIGKKLVGIRIVRPDGGRASFPRLLLLRYAVPSVVIPFALAFLPVIGPMLSSLFSLVNVLVIFGQERRCLHDKIADTIVVNS